MGKGNWLVTVGGSAGAKYATVASRHHSYEAAARATVQERALLAERGDASRCGIESAAEFVRGGGVLPDEDPAPAGGLDCTQCEGTGRDVCGSECRHCLGTSIVQCEVCGRADAHRVDDGTPVCAVCDAAQHVDGPVLLRDVSGVDCRLSAELSRAVGRAVAQLVLGASIDRIRRAAGLTGRHCTPPPAPSYAPPMPSLARRDPNSVTWRAVVEVGRETARPGAAS